MALRTPVAAALVALLAVLALAVSLVAVPGHEAHGAPDAVREAGNLLKSKDRKERLRGLELLRAMGKREAVEKAALRGLRDDDWGVQIETTRVLAEVGGEPSLDALTDLAIEGEIHWVRRAAADAVAKMLPDRHGSQILTRAKASRLDDAWVRGFGLAGAHVKAADLKLIRSALRNKDLRVPAAAIRALVGLLGDPDARDEALKALHKPLGMRAKKKHFLSYSAAVVGFAHEGSPESLDIVFDELIAQEDDDPYLLERVARVLQGADPDRTAAALERAVGRAKKPAAIRRLARLVGRIELAQAQTLLESLRSHRDPRLRSETVRALGRIRARSAAPLLQELLDDKSPYVRIEAVTALARTVPPEEFRKLSGRIAQDGTTEVRVQFVVEIVDRGEPAGIATLAEFLDDESWRVATAAAASIGTLGTVEDLPLLVPLLKSKNWRIRGAGYEGIARLRTVDGIPHLAEGLADRDPVVSGVCYANLQILTQETFEPKTRVWLRWFGNNRAKLNIVKRSRLDPAELAKLRARQEANKRYANREEEALDILEKARMIAITGAYDKVEVVLRHLSIPVNAIRAQHIKESGLNPNQLVLINCEGNVDEDAVERLRWFVNVGGYVMSTDWALTKAINACWPGYVSQFSGSSTGNDIVLIEEAAPGHPFLEGLFRDVYELEWWLEVQAFPMTIEYPERCEVLLDSVHMRQRYGSSPLCVTFRWGLGKVMHALSHFYLQEEGLTTAREPRDRMIFAADHLGMPLERIRRLETEGRWEGRLDEEMMKRIAPDYSMFRMIVNVVKEKADWVEWL